MIGAELALRSRSEPCIPIDRIFLEIGIDSVVPFTSRPGIPHVGSLSKNERTEIARLNNFRTFFPDRIRRKLRPELKRFSGFLNRIVNLERLPKMTRKRLLQINMLSGIQRIDRNPRVHLIRRGNHDRIDVGELKKLPIIKKCALRWQPSLCPRPFSIFIPKIANGSDSYIC